MFDPRGPTFGELARQALSSTRRGYDLLAPKFDWTPFRTPDWLLDAVAPHLGPPRSIGSAVDLGCGTGAALRILRPLCRERVVGVDFSLGMLAMARSRQQTATWLQQDLLALGLRPVFDLATAFGVLGHLRPAVQARFLAEVRNCLAAGGRLALVTAPLPALWSPALWLAGAFDAAMWVRNRLWRPPFVMYYLAWPLARSERRLREAGFTVRAVPLVDAEIAARDFPPQLAYPLTRLRLLLAVRE